MNTSSFGSAVPAVSTKLWNAFVTSPAGDAWATRTITARARTHRMPTRRRLQVLLDLGFELAARHRADELADDPAALEDQERRNRRHAVLLRDDLVVVDVHLGHLELALVLVGERIDGGRDLLAGAAPDRPKIHEGRNV